MRFTKWFRASLCETRFFFTSPEYCFRRRSEGTGGRSEKSIIINNIMLADVFYCSRPRRNLPPVKTSRRESWRATSTYPNVCVSHCMEIKMGLNVRGKHNVFRLGTSGRGTLTCGSTRRTNMYRTSVLGQHNVDAWQYSGGPGLREGCGTPRKPLLNTFLS